jgi:FlaA1/EpsC-like NDP-sugar epimerase
LNNRALHYAPIGFIDDDPNKKGKVIHGLRVLGGNGTLQHICRQERIDEILISSSKFTKERIGQIKRDCRESNVLLKQMLIKIERLDED